MQTITVKAGESYSAAGIVAVSSGGVAVDVTGYTPTAQVRDTASALVGDFTVDTASALVGDFTVVLDAGTAGTFVLSATAAETLTWPVGTHLCDVRCVLDGAVAMSPTFAVRVTPAITEAAA